MYIPIAVYKNNIVLVDNMDTFALYFCSSVKQRMRPSLAEGALDYDGEGAPGEADDEFGAGGFSEDFDAPSDDDDDL